MLDPPRERTVPAGGVSAVAARRPDPYATTVERPVGVPDVPQPQTAHTLRLLFAAVLVTALVVVTAMNVTGTGPFRSTRIGSSIHAAQTQIERDLAFAVEEVEAYRHEHGTLPGDLTPFDFGREPGWSYERVAPDAFRLTLEVDGMRVSWDSRRTENRDGMDAVR